MGVRTQNHPAASSHHFPVVAVDYCHVGGNVDAAVFVSSREREHMVIFIDGAADSAQGVVAVGQNIGHGEFLHAGSPGGLDDAHIGNVMAGQTVELHAKVLHVIGGVVSFQDAVGHGAFASLFLGDGLTAQTGQRSRIFYNRLAVDQIHAAFEEFNHVRSLLCVFLGIFIIHRFVS